MLLCSCTTYSWYKPGASPQEGSRDVSDCQLAAARAYPVAARTIITQQGYQTQGQTTCMGMGNMVNCQTTPSQNVPAKGFVVDGNEDARTNAYDNCMRGKGWELRVDKPASTATSTNLSKNNATGCYGSAECPDDMYCIQGRCARPPTTRAESESSAGKIEQGAQNKSAPSQGKQAGDSCSQQNDCGRGLFCRDSVCTPFHTKSGGGASGVSCVSQAECGKGMFCNGSVCAPFK